VTWPEWDAGPYPLDDAEAGRLRRDIRDELADHLHSALERQRRVTSDEEEARRTVLARFGDPNQIAHQLWLQARKAQAMRERILLAFTAVLAVVCLGALAVAWMALQDVRRSNEALLEKLSSLKIAAEPAAAASDRCSVTIELFKGEQGERPAEGFGVSLLGEPAAAGQKATLHATSDSAGRASFSPIRPGTYHLNVRSPWGYRFSRRLLILAGQSLQETILCPYAAPPTADLAFALEIPDDIRKHAPLVLATIVPLEPSIKVGEAEWRDEKEISVTLDTEGRILPKYSILSRPPEEYEDPMQRLRFMRRPILDIPITDKAPETLAKLRCEAKKYRLARCQVLTPPAGRAFGPEGVYRQSADCSFPDRKGPVFEVRDDRPNVWKIALKPEDWSSVRMQLPRESPKAGAKK